MVSIKWCLNVKNGIEIVEPSRNMSDSYLRMAEESLETIRKVDSKIWLASMSYYTIYYCLYAVMTKIGVKCEIHACSVEFMKQFLNEFYDGGDAELISLALDNRESMQYYPDRLVDEGKLEFARKGAADFFVKTKNILAKISEREIKEIRKKLGEKRDEIKKK